MACRGCLASWRVVPSPELLEQRARAIGQSGALLAVPVEVTRVAPGEECLAQRRLPAADGGVPGRVAVGGRGQPHVDLPGALLADALPVLESRGRGCVPRSRKGLWQRP